MDAKRRQRLAFERHNQGRFQRGHDVELTFERCVICVKSILGRQSRIYEGTEVFSKKFP